MIDVFLSASIPLPERDRVFFETADVLSIREAIKALVEVILPEGRDHLWRPSRYYSASRTVRARGGSQPHHMTIYQSRLFEERLPPELRDFVDVRMIQAIGQDQERSKTAMRREMISSRSFAAAVFIGGMEGIFEEHDLFIKSHPAATILPLATTGAAAAIVCREGNYDLDLNRDRTYASLFRRRLLGAGARPRPRPN